MDAVAGSFQHRTQKRTDGALAVGSGNMNHRRNAPFGVTEPFQQALDAIQYEIDAFGMKRQKPLQDGVAALGSRHDPAGADDPFGTGCFISRRSSVASRSLSS